jgi:hypothetical protein
MAMVASKPDCCKETAASFVVALSNNMNQYASACSGSKTAGASGKSYASSSCSKSASYAKVESVDYREGKRVVLTGYALCGKCKQALSAVQKQVRRPDA